MQKSKNGNLLVLFSRICRNNFLKTEAAHQILYTLMNNGRRYGEFRNPSIKYLKVSNKDRH